MTSPTGLFIPMNLHKKVWETCDIQLNYAEALQFTLHRIVWGQHHSLTNVNDKVRNKLQNVIKRYFTHLNLLG